jgi:hypothetical protein
MARGGGQKPPNASSLPTGAGGLAGGDTAVFALVAAVLLWFAPDILPSAAC